MARIPLMLRLKKRAHKDVAAVQDILVRELYNLFDEAVLHGGTAIWRCYAGNRFSEDLDVYIPRDGRRIDLLFENLEKKGFAVKKKKVGENSLFSELELNRVSVRLEALFKKAEGHLAEYETADGNFITVYTLTPEEFVGEKIAAYLKRLKIRDLYDIFFLLRLVRERKEVPEGLKRLIREFKDPVDEKDLRVLIIEGITPTSAKMMEYVKRW
ncbi:MAG: nucleotidyl transferase AbiEii/AbiGii toxin family protein [Candidatus Altiarchaeota archaeon]|nr:nucleotidyl transferase AbiEii/AbiGii toxin family protein [Candidatus Altiarchaeota archaeon]